MDKHPKGKGCWYFTTIFYCPQCGRSEEHRERMWTEKPEDHSKRFEWIDAWDYCGAL